VPFRWSHIEYLNHIPRLKSTGFAVADSHPHDAGIGSFDEQRSANTQQNDAGASGASIRQLERGGVPV